MTNSKNKMIKINGERIYLKTLAEKNATREYCKWLNDPEVNKYLETRQATINELKEYIKEKNKNTGCLFLGIFSRENRKHIGNIKLEPIDLRVHKATMGILIGDKNYWGMGIGTEATKLILRYGFYKLGLKKINLSVISENKAAIKVYEKAGFKINRIEKESIRHEQKLFDKVMMSVKN